MTKHTMTGVQALNTFLYENGGMRVWRAFDIGPGKFYSAAQLPRLGTPQGPSKLSTFEPFSNPAVETGTYQQHIGQTGAISKPRPSRELPSPTDTDEDIKMFSCQVEGCIKTFQSFCPPKAPGYQQAHGKAGKRVRLRQDKKKMDGDVPFRRR